MLVLLQSFRSQSSDPRVCLLSAYANVSSAVMSIKSGALDFLAKQANAGMIDTALNAPEIPRIPAPPEQFMSGDPVKWE